ncbi:acetyl-CoA C-acyltransferase, partial [Streptomyces sp. SID10244]|nr:acetyl-CoA C-acyltransferase [Streptomyces sp. SID10244]
TRVARARAEGRFADEIVPVTVPATRRTPERTVDTDEHPRPGTTAEDLAALRPVRAGLDPEATVTAGNSSGQNDGAA